MNIQYLIFALILYFAAVGYSKYLNYCNQLAIFAEGAPFIVRSDLILRFDEDKLVTVCKAHNSNEEFVRVKLIKDKITVYGVVNDSNLRVINP